MSQTARESKSQNTNNRRIYLTLLKGGALKDNGRLSRTCELCKHKFHPSSRFSLFCDRCKHNDRYRYAEWLPSSDDV